MKRPVLQCLVSSAVLCLVLLGAQSLRAQSTTGSIYGQVTDPSGAVVTGAEVTALNQATGVPYKSRTDGSGDYAVFDTPPGCSR